MYGFPDEFYNLADNECTCDICDDGTDVQGLIETMFTSEIAVAKLALDVFDDLHSNFDHE